MANQAKLRSFRLTPKYTYEHSKQLDKVNKNKKLHDYTNFEMSQLDEYDTFINHGVEKTAPQGYKIIRTNLMYDIKHDGRHKAHCVDNGHLADIPIDSVYLGVVSLRGLRIMLFLAESNKLDIWTTDMGNAYLETKTSERQYIIAGPQFGKK